MDARARRSDAPFAISDERTADLRDRSGSTLFHHQREFQTQDVEDALHSGLPEARQTPHIWTSDADRACTQRERLEDIRPATDSAIDQDRNTAGSGFDHLGEAVDRASSALFGTASVV